MKYEIGRQIVHFAGLIFIILSFYIGKFTASLIFFIIALMFFVYGELIIKGRGLGLLGSIEDTLREKMLKMDRGVRRPLIGAFWFYFGLGLAFLAFPFEIAVVTGLILVIADSMSTIIGMRWGNHKIVGGKSLEGSITFFIFSFLITIVSLEYILVEASPFTISVAAFLVSIAATFLELVPEINRIKNWKNKEIVDDNWIIPLFSGLIIYVAFLITVSV
jgi:dolichol kinase